MKSGFRRIWDALPIDGAGWVPPADPDARALIRFTTARRLDALPAITRPAFVFAARLLWCVKAIGVVRGPARRLGIPVWRLYADACRYGLQPKDSQLWRGPLGAPARPLTGHAFAKILSSVGDPAQLRLLTDKVATAALLERRGVPTPKLLGVIPRGGAPVLPDGPDLFVKPRAGARSRDAFRITGAERHDPAVLARLRSAAASDTLLVQQCLAPAPELADLATAGVPPVLRLITARERGGQPFLHSALFSIRVPGEPAKRPLRSLLRVPVRIADGKLLPGYWLADPQATFERSPWHDAPIAGRALPDFSEAVHLTNTAAQAFGGLALIGWDVILSATGPVILEGNANTDWLFITLVGKGAPGAPPLLPLLRGW